jgi:2-methylcitrate dehydratase PrpD
MQVTEALSNYVSNRRFDDLSPEEMTVAKHCLLDYLGVTLAGRDEPLVRILREEAHDEGGNQQASLVGEDRRVTVSQASLINGSAAHAHDYDDVHTAMSGHPTVPVAPAVMALAEKEGSSGRELLQALVTGIETECLLGRFVGGTHYRAGFHATGTLGSFGAAAACANLLQLDEELTAQALGIAATQAAGLKSMFGTMCKPFHAGKAAANGLASAILAQRGFTSNPAGIETEQGFGATHSTSLSKETFTESMKAGNLIPATLFKYHAACYLTHSAMEGTRHLMKEHGIAADDVDAVNLTVDEGHLSVCNIQDPTTGLEAKFSLRFATAMILCGVDTSSIDSFTDELTRNERLVETRDKVRVAAYSEPNRDTLVQIQLKDGSNVETSWNVAIPEKDLDLQWHKLSAKFLSLAKPAIGEGAGDELLQMIERVDGLNSLDEFFRLVRGVQGGTKH